MKLRGPGKHLHRCITRELNRGGIVAMGHPALVDGKTVFDVCARFRVGPDNDEWPYECQIELTMAPAEARDIARRLNDAATRAELLTLGCDRPDGSFSALPPQELPDVDTIAHPKYTSTAKRLARMLGFRV